MINAFPATGECGGLRLPRFTLGITTLAIALYALFGPAPELWVFDRVAIAQGEWWRLVSGHLVHSDFEHAFWDILAFALIGALVEQSGSGRTRAAAAISLLMVDAWLWWGAGYLRWYCGLSGIINTLLVLLIDQLWREEKSVWVALGAAGYGIKLLVEAVTGNALLTATAWPSVVSVHLVGVAVAVVFLIFRGSGNWKTGSENNFHYGRAAYRKNGVREQKTLIFEKIVL